MRASVKIDYSKLLGFNVLGDELVDGVDFQNQNVGAKLGAKVGDKLTIPPKIIDLPLEVGDASPPIMQGFGKTKVAST